jgi:hypothetical protein
MSVQIQCGGWHSIGSASACLNLDIIKPAIYGFLMFPADELNLTDCDFIPDYLAAESLSGITEWLLQIPPETPRRYNMSWNNMLKLFIWLAEQRGLV